MILGGETIVPTSGVFGPGFERKEVKYAVDGKDLDGYKGIRVPSVSDAACREW